jgi:hypothetical protein
MGDEIFATPLPFLAFGVVVGLITSASLKRPYRRGALLVAALGASVFAVALVSMVSIDPLEATDRVVIATATAAGAWMGSLPVAYVRWVRRTFRAASVRLSEPVDHDPAVGPT